MSREIHNGGQRCRATVLVVGTSEVTTSNVAAAAESLGIGAVHVPSAATALLAFAELDPLLVVVAEDVDIPAEMMVRQFHDAATNLPILVLSGTPPTDESAMVRAGALQVVHSAARVDQLTSVISSLVHPGAGDRRSNVVDEQRTEFFRTYASLFRRGPTSRELERTVVSLARRDGCLAIVGESGVGKKTIARAVHYLSDRSGAPLTYLNCAALPADLLEDALFGAEGQALEPRPEIRDRTVEASTDGTLVLAEYDLLPPALQQQVARLIAESADHKRARILATTSTVMSGGDRWESLRVPTITIPPLRMHADDIPGLAEFFRLRFMEQYRRDTPPLSDSMLARLRAYPWPGNVLELEHLIKRYVVFGAASTLLDELGTRTRLAAASARGGQRTTNIGLREIGRRAAREAETAAILTALEQANGNRAEAARLLKVSYKTLLNKISSAGIVGTPRTSPRLPNDRS